MENMPTVLEDSLLVLIGGLLVGLGFFANDFFRSRRKYEERLLERLTMLFPTPFPSEVDRDEIIDNITYSGENAFSWQRELKAAQKFISEPRSVQAMIVHEMALAELIEETFDSLRESESNFTQMDDENVVHLAGKFAKREEDKKGLVSSTKRKIQSMLNSRMKSFGKNWLGADEGSDSDSE